MIYDTLLEVANEIFDTVCFDYEDILDKYNSLPYESAARDELYEIVGMMIESAEDAMYECAKEHREDREEFVALVMSHE